MPSAEQSTGVLLPGVAAAPSLQEQIFQHFLGQIAAHKDVTEPIVEAFQQLIHDGGVSNKEKILRVIGDAVAGAEGESDGDAH